MYRLRSALALFSWLGLPLVLTVVQGVLGRPISNKEFAPIGLGWMVLFAGSQVWRVMWRCPRCGRQFFFSGLINVFARRCMHCGLPKWSQSSLTMAPARIKLPARAWDAEAEVRFLSTTEGGRTRSVKPGYRAQLHYDERDWDAVYDFVERDRVRPGETAIARMWLLTPEAHRGKLAPGKSFSVREGQRIVARGVITKAFYREPHRVAEGH
jgi:ribosomal protein L37E